MKLDTEYLDGIDSNTWIWSGITFPYGIAAPLAQIPDDVPDILPHSPVKVTAWRETMRSLETI